MIPFHEMHVTGIVRFQALWRGYMTRKRMKAIKEVYSQICLELEDDLDCDIHWNLSLYSNYKKPVSLQDEKMIESKCDKMVDPLLSKAGSSLGVELQSETVHVPLEQSINDACFDKLDTKTNRNNQKEVNSNNHGDKNNEAMRSANLPPFKEDIFNTSTPNQLLLPKDQLVKQRNTVAMELLWIQQALESRKQYLKMKTEMSG